MREHYDKNDNCLIEDSEVDEAFNHVQGGSITDAEFEKVIEAYETQTNLCFAPPTSAKGEIVNPSHPSTATNGETISIRASVKNSGGMSGNFKFYLYLGAIKVSQSSLHTVAAGSTGPIQSLSVTVPSSGSAVSYIIKCIRVT